MQGNEELKIVQMLEQRKFSTRELAAHAELPVPTVKLLVKEGVLVPSFRAAEGRGRGMVFSADDVTAARALSAVRFQNMGADPERVRPEVHQGVRTCRAAEGQHHRDEGTCPPSASAAEARQEEARRHHERGHPAAEGCPRASARSGDDELARRWSYVRSPFGSR